eukprot:399954_1
MLAALSLLDDVINEIMLSGSQLDDRSKNNNLTYNNLVLDGRFIDFNYKKISKFVNTKLSEISNKHECQILYCAERSSHVWGTSHANSDNDIKAIIYYKPKDYYSPIKQIIKSFKLQYGPRDPKNKNKEFKQDINEPDVELNCIELTKIGQMIIKNDPNVFEMFASPLPYYISNNEIIQKFQQIIYSTYDWYKLANHYIAWANGNFRQLEKTKKKRMVRNQLKILFVVVRGILSAEWLLNHYKCKGLPLYVPDLITYSNILNNEEKKIIMKLLVTKLRNGLHEIDCDDSRYLKNRVRELINVIDQMLHDQNPNKGNKEKPSITKRVNKLKEHSTMMMGSSVAKKLENIVFDVIESFK